MMTLSGLSQTPSTDRCIVPCSTLRNALIEHEQFILINNKNKVLRDSIFLIEKEILQKDTIILNKNGEIKKLENDVQTNENKYNEEKKRADHYKTEWEKQRLYKWVGYALTVVTVFLSITR